MCVYSVCAYSVRACVCIVCVCVCVLRDSLLIAVSVAG